MSDARKALADRIATLTAYAATHPSDGQGIDERSAYLLAAIQAPAVVQGVLSGLVLLRKARDEIEWWVSEHSCCAGHEEPVLTEIDAHLQAHDAPMTREAASRRWRELNEELVRIAPLLGMERIVPRDVEDDAERAEIEVCPTCHLAGGAIADERDAWRAEALRLRAASLALRRAAE